MKKLLNTLYVTSENSYLSLDGENVVVLERGISLCYLTPQGKFLARVSGKIKGNVVLRQQQYASSQDEQISLDIARNCILGKVHNARWVLERAVRDHSLQIDTDKVRNASGFLKQ